MDVIAIVEMMESQGLLRANKPLDSWYQIYCPFHGDGNERRPSCGVSLKAESRAGKNYPAGSFHCFSCNYTNTLAGAVTDILKLKSITKSGMDWLSENIPDFEIDADFDYLIPFDLSDAVASKLAAATTSVQQLSELLSPKKAYISEEELAGYRFTIPYMYERKLTDQVIDQFDVGFDANWVMEGRKRVTPCLTFPVHDEQGNVLFIYRRAVEVKLFGMPSGLTKPVYGLYQLRRDAPDTTSVIITESIINCLTAWAYGMPALALMATGNSYQIEQLRRSGIREFVLCMDGDEAGRRATAKLKKALREVALIWTITMPDGVDLNDCTKEQFYGLYGTKE